MRSHGWKTTAARLLSLSLIVWLLLAPPALATSHSGGASAPSAHHHRHWVWPADNCTITEQVAPTGSTAGAPTPLPGLHVQCVYVPGHWAYAA